MEVTTVLIWFKTFGLSDHDQTLEVLCVERGVLDVVRHSTTSLDSLVEEARVPRHATREPHRSTSPRKQNDRSQQVQRSRLFLGSVVFGGTTMHVASQMVPTPTMCHQDRGKSWTTSTPEISLEEDPNVEEVSPFPEWTSVRRV